MQRNVTPLHFIFRWMVSLILLVGLTAGCSQKKQDEGSSAKSDGQMNTQKPMQVAKKRGLTPSQATAAMKTYQPTGTKDEYLMFASGGHSGQVMVIGVPSMRILRMIGVFTPEPWQGYGYSQGTKATLSDGKVQGKKQTWGDTHHPALSETDGVYDGEYLFINDKSNARVGVISLKDFETKQIVNNPLSKTDHGGTFVTPNTEWVIEGGQYGVPLEGYASLDQYKEKYRGMVTFWKFNRDKGRIIKNKSFAMELPPYWQDLSDAGKNISKGWVFQNSLNTEMAKGGTNKGNPPFEAGASQRDMDYLHMINLKKAAKLYRNGQTKKVKGMNVLTLDKAIQEGVLYFVPEPKSPHGIDVAPNGRYLVVSGKLDPNVTVYDFKQIKKAIKNENFSGKDPYGVPIVNYDAAVEAQVKVGLGPLHTQFGPDGVAYTSLFLESAVASWTLGGDWKDEHGKKPWTVQKKQNIHYNVGHLALTAGDTKKPQGDYLVSLNKWSKDRFANTGPLLPQNLQLIDINSGSGNMQLLYDMPIGMGEPHYAQIMKTDKVKAWRTYPKIGWNPHKMKKSKYATKPGDERIERQGNTVEIFMTATRSHYTPEHVKVEQGDRVIWHVTNVEQAVDATHGFGLPTYNVNMSLEPGETQTIRFTADEPGVYSFYCTEFCSALHLEMAGYLLVEPKKKQAKAGSPASKATASR